MIKLSTVVFTAILSTSSISVFAENAKTHNISVEDAKEQTISINNADAKSLMKIKGIGIKTAQAIIEYRNLNGDFKTISELLKVKGVGVKVLAKNEKRLTI